MFVCVLVLSGVNVPALARNAYNYASSVGIRITVHFIFILFFIIIVDNHEPDSNIPTVIICDDRMDNIEFINVI